MMWAHIIINFFRNTYIYLFFKYLFYKEREISKKNVVNDHLIFIKEHNINNSY